MFEPRASGPGLTHPGESCPATPNCPRHAHHLSSPPAGARRRSRAGGIPLRPPLLVGHAVRRAPHRARSPGGSDAAHAAVSRDRSPARAGRGGQHRRHQRRVGRRPEDARGPDARRARARRAHRRARRRRGRLSRAPRSVAGSGSRSRHVFRRGCVDAVFRARGHRDASVLRHATEMGSRLVRQERPHRRREGIGSVHLRAISLRGIVLRHSRSQLGAESRAGTPALRLAVRARSSEHLDRDERPAPGRHRDAIEQPDGHRGCGP